MFNLIEDIGIISYDDVGYLDVVVFQVRNEKIEDVKEIKRNKKEDILINNTLRKDEMFIISILKDSKKMV